MKAIYKLIIAPSFLLLTFPLLIGCRSENERQHDTETVSQSQAQPFTKEIYLEILEKKGKNEPYPQLVYTFSGIVTSVEFKQTRSATSLDLDLLLWSEPDVEAACEFDSRSLDFISGQRVGNEIKLRAKLSSVTAGRVSFVGAIQEQATVQPHS